jgi:hypothetical protein
MYFHTFRTALATIRESVCCVLHKEKINVSTDRFLFIPDVSKTEQWEVVFEHADKIGMLCM